MDSGAIAFYISLELLIAALAVAGNVLVCWAVTLNSNLQSITNYFVVSLAAADVAVGLLAIPFAIVISTGFCSNFHGCLFIACFVLVLTQSSIFSLLAIAVDRYIAIKIPLRYNSLVTNQRAKCIIYLCWILSVIIGLTPMLGWHMPVTNVTNSSCPPGMTECLFERVVTMDYMVYFNFFVCVLIPLVVMLVIYARIFMAACRQLRQMEHKTSYSHSEGSSSTSSTRSVLQREVHAAKSLAIIVGLFAICWLPLHIINCFTLFCPQCLRPPHWIMYLAIILSHANSVVNPFIYAYRIRDFRLTFRRIIRQHFLRRRDRLPKSKTCARINIIESSFTNMTNGNVLYRCQQKSLTIVKEIHCTDKDWSSNSSQNNKDPECSIADPLPDQISNEISSEIMLVNDCCVITNVNLSSISSRTKHAVELTQVS
ncbi:Adenosine receptor A2a [Bagarius yarrelli]|uniref:Adenosine receptor A2 n=1 Tax=Bagarius yarrelli TaxID=175774 RepID=A0A556TWV0_BAGYA|nr:Adenosine receptor A2a [Bagarius yarrelli]